MKRRIVAAVVTTVPFAFIFVGIWTDPLVSFSSACALTGLFALLYLAVFSVGQLVAGDDA